MQSIYINGFSLLFPTCTSNDSNIWKVEFSKNWGWGSCAWYWPCRLIPSVGTAKGTWDVIYLSLRRPLIRRLSPATSTVRLWRSLAIRKQSWQRLIQSLQFTLLCSWRCNFFHQIMWHRSSVFLLDLAVCEGMDFWVEQSSLKTQALERLATCLKVTLQRLIQSVMPRLGQGWYRLSIKIALVMTCATCVHGRQQELAGYICDLSCWFWNITLECTKPLNKLHPRHSTATHFAFGRWCTSVP